MQTKMIEIRDDGTTIPAVAIRMAPANEIEDQFLWREGYPRDGSGVVLMRLADQKATSDPYEWPALSSGTRTMCAAHLYVLEHWDRLADGSVVDARVWFGEATEPVGPEIWTGSPTGDFNREPIFQRNREPKNAP